MLQFQPGCSKETSPNSSSSSSQRTPGPRSSVGPLMLTSLLLQRKVQNRTYLAPAFRPLLLITSCSAPPKPEAEIQKEIRHIIKQVVASVTFLPLVYEPTVFNLLVYTNDSADVPEQEWLDTDPMAIEAGLSQQVRTLSENRLETALARVRHPTGSIEWTDACPWQVKLRSFSTDFHRVCAMVTYRCVALSSASRAV